MLRSCLRDKNLEAFERSLKQASDLDAAISAHRDALGENWRSVAIGLVVAVVGALIILYSGLYYFLPRLQDNEPRERVSPAAQSDPAFKAAQQLSFHLRQERQRDRLISSVFLGTFLVGMVLPIAMIFKYWHIRGLLESRLALLLLYRQGQLRDESRLQSEMTRSGSEVPNP